MATHLTYHTLTGSITGTAAGQRVSADTQPAGDPGNWARVKGLEVQWEVVDYEPGGSRALESRLPRAAGGTQSPPGSSGCRHYTARKNLLIVDDGGPGLLIHGWPPCGGGRCVAVKRGWDALLGALMKERRGSIRIL